jgi:integrase
VIGLLVVTGMRSGEAVRLNRGDVDFDAGRLRVVATKFNKSRELGLHPTTVEALEGYTSLRDRQWPLAVTAGFFVSGTGRRLAHSSLISTFAGLVRRAGRWCPHRNREHAAQGSMTRATASPWPLCSAGTAPARTSKRCCRRCQPSSATSIQHPPTGT